MKRNITQGILGALITGSALLLVIVGCNSSTNPPPFSGPLELLYPKGGSGQSFQVGQPVQIKWSIHDKTQIGSVGIKYSLDNGKIWSTTPIGNGSLSFPDTTYSWVPTADQISNQFVLKVYEYQNEATINNKSVAFIVHQ